MVWIYFGLAFFSAMLTLRQEMMTINTDGDQEMAVVEVQPPATKTEELTAAADWLNIDQAWLTIGHKL